MHLFGGIAGTGGVYMSKKQASQLMDYVDKDGSGHITYDEFKHYILEKANARKGKSGNAKDNNDDGSREKRVATEAVEEKKKKTTRVRLYFYDISDRC